MPQFPVTRYRARRILPRMIGWSIVLGALPAMDRPPAPAFQVGFQQLAIPYEHDSALAVGLWYPTSALESEQPLGLSRQHVAVNGHILSGRHPFVVIAHGTGGWLGSHFDTAHELARAGFVVAAITFLGDNSRDQSAAGSRRDLIDRPRQLRRMVDYLQREWTGRDRIDSTRIGIFGFSLGGYTALVAIGGTPEFALIPRFCLSHAQAPECQFVRQRRGDQLDTLGAAAHVDWATDERYRVAVIAAPAVVFAFGDSGLRAIRIPVQLWRASDDSLAPRDWNSDVVERTLYRRPETHTVRHALHYDFLAPCSAALAQAVPPICVEEVGFDRAEFHRAFNTAVVRYFLASLSSR